MAGGLRLAFTLSFILLAAAAYAGDDSKSSSTSAGPPVAEEKPVIDMFHGTKVLDNYRWLEDGKSPATQKWVEEEMSYTRGMLDRLAGTRRDPQTSDRAALDRQRYASRTRWPALFLYPAGRHAEPAYSLRA